MRSNLLCIWILLFFSIYKLNAQNLITNPGAELDPLTNGWSEGVVAMPTNTFHWTRSNNFLGEAIPHGGSYHFYANDNSNGNYYLYQDVDVSAYAAHIDAGTCPFTYSFWTRMYNYSGLVPNDAARAYVEYRDAFGTILSSYDSGWRTHLVWTQVTDTRTAPVGTRTIRIRLQSGFTSGSGADGYFDDLSLTTPVTLPVTLTSFEAKAIDEFIHLNWSTSSETNNAYFILQRSNDGEHWENISQQEGSKESVTAKKYKYIDETPFTGTNYYRLLQVDENGSKNYSKIITCYFQKENSLKLYPNPCPQEESLKIIGGENLFLQVYASDGKLIFSGSSEIFDSRILTPGVYYFQIFTKEKSYSEKINIQ